MAEWKLWKEMTFDEKMVQIEEDFEQSLADQVQRKILETKREWVAGIDYAKEDVDATVAIYNKQPSFKTTDIISGKVDWAALELRVLASMYIEPDLLKDISSGRKR